jgi:DNA-binding NtrC family response regulator
VSPDAIQLLQQQPWPGNVRELENVVRKALLLARGYMIGTEAVSQALAQTKPLHPGADQTLSAFVSDLLGRATRGELENIHEAFTQAAERELYAQAIELAQGNQAKVAKWLGVSRPTVREKLSLYSLHPKRNTDPA